MRLESAVESHLAAIRKRRDGRAEAKALYQLLLQPVALLAQSTRVVIVPDGKLHLVAFEALLDPNRPLRCRDTRDFLRAISNGLLLAFETEAIADASDGNVSGGGRTLYVPWIRGHSVSATGARIVRSIWSTALVADPTIAN